MTHRYIIRAHVPANGAPGEPEREFIQYAPTKAMALERFGERMPHHRIERVRRVGENIVVLHDGRKVTG